MFFVEKKPTAIYLVRDKQSSRYMGFDDPTVYWTLEQAEFAIKRQQGRRQENIEWEVLRVPLPEEG